MGKLFTIGHSTHSFDYFVNLLISRDINYLIDVRSTPYSRYVTAFNREVLKESLLHKNITYAYMGVSFGARQTNDSFFTDGYVDFEKVILSTGFVKSMDNVLDGLEQGNNIVFMCTEKDPIDCHRAIMVARGFSLQGVDVFHILANGELQTQKDLDRRLLDRFFPEKNQMSIFDLIEPQEERSYLDQAYKLRNKEIGYRIKNNEE